MIPPDEHNSKRKDKNRLTRVFHQKLAEGTKVADVRLMDRTGQISHSLRIHRKPTNENATGIVLGLLSIGAPFILHFIGRNHLRNFEKSRSKAKVPFFWAVASLAHIFNFYLLLKLLTIRFFYNHVFYKIRVNTASLCIIILLTLIESGFLAYNHRKYITFPIPKSWSIFTKCCGRKQHRIITTISLWGIYTSVVGLLVCLPLQALLVSVNPHLYGFAILTVWCVMFVCIIVTSIPFTIDQIFIKEEEYRITPKQALRQILLLMFIAVLVFGFGSLTFSITLVLHLSKYGEETRTFSSSVMFVLNHTLLPIVAWIIRRVGVKVRETVQQMLNVQDEI